MTSLFLLQPPQDHCQCFDHGFRVGPVPLNGRTVFAAVLAFALGFAVSVYDANEKRKVWQIVHGTLRLAGSKVVKKSSEDVTFCRLRKVKPRCMMPSCFPIPIYMRRMQSRVAR